jgi:hypothetical protein
MIPHRLPPEQRPKHPADGGYKSRKLTLAYVALVLMTIGFFATARWPSLATTYMEFNMAVLAAASIYTGGNTLTKWINARKAATKKVAKAPVVPPGK